MRTVKFNGTALFAANKEYKRGDKVTYKNRQFEATRTVLRDQAPPTINQDWLEIGTSHDISGRALL